MFLHEVFPPEKIIMELEAENKDEVFEELVDHHCRISNSNDRDIFTSFIAMASSTAVTLTISGSLTSAAIIASLI